MVYFIRPISQILCIDTAKIEEMSKTQREARMKNRRERKQKVSIMLSRDSYSGLIRRNLTLVQRLLWKRIPKSGKRSIVGLFDC